jgi:probable phosphoglycerate mutase
LTRIYLIRHGLTEWNKLHRIQGSGADPPLFQEGYEQAEEIAKYLGPVDAIYSSPLLRARETAAPIARCNNKDIIIEPDLREISAGELEGVSNEELGMTLAQYLTTPSGGNLPHPPGGESLVELQERAWQAFTKIAALHSGSKVAVVSHYFVILTIICRIIGLTLVNLDHLRLDTASISVVGYDGRGWWLGLFNRTIRNGR